MRTLIFGATGFLGSHLSEKLVEKNHHVGIYTRKNSRNKENLRNIIDKVENIEGDYTKEEHFDEILKGYNYVYQLISTSVPNNMDPVKDIETNIKPMVKLLNACVKNRIKKVVFFSSGGTVYGIPQNIPIQETDPTNPISIYGIQKLTIEKYLQVYYRMYGLDYTILRIANPYGARQRPFETQGVIATLLGKFLTGESIEIWGDGNIVRDYICVQDVINIAIEALGYTGSVKIFNIGTGRGYSINEILQLIEDIVGEKLDVIYTIGRKQDVPINILDNSLVKRIFGYNFEVDLKCGINEMLKSWNSVNQKFDLY